MAKLSNEIKTPNISLFVAPPRSGKTFLMRYLIYTLACEGKFKYGLVFSPTQDDSFDKLIPEKYIHRQFDEQKLKLFLRKQKKTKLPAFLILDDAAGSIDMNGKLFNHLFTSYRHYNLSIFVSIQWIHKVAPVVRNCTTYAFVFKHSNQKSYEVLHSAFFADKDNWKETRDEINNSLKQPYSFILIKPEEGTRKVLKAPNIQIRRLNY